MSILPTFSLSSLPLTRLQESSRLQIHHCKRVTAGQRAQSCVLPAPLQGNPESHQDVQWVPNGDRAFHWALGEPTCRGEACGLEKDVSVETLICEERILSGSNK